MTPASDFSRDVTFDETDAGSRNAVADLVRHFVRARRGVSRFATSDWVTRFIGDGRAPDLTAMVDGVIGALVDVGDIGSGQIRGEPMLFALPVRRVGLPDGRVILLGDHGAENGGRSGLLFPVAEGGAELTLIDLLGDSNAVMPDQLPVFSPRGQWPEGSDMPPDVRRALILCSDFDPLTSSWSMSDANAAFLNEWFGAGQDRADETGDGGRDDAQDRIIAAAPDARIVAEAGPGTGKTWVACERVRKLVIEDAVAPSGVVLLSFTRLAVAELRQRVESRLSQTPELASIQIFTFDSFAAKLSRTYGKTLAGGYDQGIRTATGILSSGDYLITDYIAQIGHLIIDEAQDLVGDRKAMCNALLKLVGQDCGVTVFGDFAQSIYGYQAHAADPVNFLSEVAKRPDFTALSLSTDHRTKSALLTNMFQSVRETLRSGQTKETYFEVRDQIRSGAIENDISDFSSHPSTTGGLILTRSRAALMAAADMMRDRGRRFRIHLPDRPLRVKPWIGAVLGGLPASQTISREVFNGLYDDLHPPCVKTADECWSILRALDGSARSGVTVGRVADALEDPPLDLLDRYEGDTGPLLSTIHALKGGEDQRVMLLLTRAPKREETDWEEEARTLYVGASRAVRELRTGWINPARLYKKGRPERYWIPRAGHWLVETGLEGDLLNWHDFAKTGYGADRAGTIAAIWKAAGAKAPAEATTDAKGNFLLLPAGRGKPLACFSGVFCGFIRSVSGADPQALLPSQMTGFTISGATTIVVPGAPGEMPGLSLLPLLSGFGRIER